MPPRADTRLLSCQKKSFDDSDDCHLQFYIFACFHWTWWTQEVGRPELWTSFLSFCKFEAQLIILTILGIMQKNQLMNSTPRLHLVPIECEQEQTVKEKKCISEVWGNKSKTWFHWELEATRWKKLIIWRLVKSLFICIYKRVSLGAGDPFYIVQTTFLTKLWVFSSLSSS